MAYYYECSITATFTGCESPTLCAHTVTTALIHYSQHVKVITLIVDELGPACHS